MARPIIVHQVGGVWQRWPGTPNISAVKVAELVASGVWTGADLDPLGAKVAAAFVLPAGKMAVGVERFDEEAGVVSQVFDVEDLPPPDPAEIQAAFAAAIQAHLDDAARVKRYDSLASCISYAGSTVPQWAAEAAAALVWRDAIWAYAYTELDKALFGERPVPTIEDFLAELPAIEWPGAAS